MSQMGQIQSSRNACVTSGLPLIADMRRTGLDVCLVPGTAVPGFRTANDMCMHLR
jgi:hypothetical protein